MNPVTDIIQSAEQWADEAIVKYDLGAVAWLKRWKNNCQNYPDDLAELDKAIQMVEERQGSSSSVSPSRRHFVHLSVMPACNLDGGPVGKDCPCDVCQLVANQEDPLNIADEYDRQVAKAILDYLGL